MKIKLCAFADEANASLEGQIKALKENNISLIEARGVDGKNILTLTDDEAKNAYEQLKKNGIGVWSIGSPIGKVDISSDLDDYMNKVVRACEIAKIMHCENVRMFSFFKALDQKERVHKYVKKMVEIGNKYGVKMCHENEKGIYGDIEPRVTELLDNIPGLLNVYDPSNYVQCEQDNHLAIQKLFDRTYYFHIKDCQSSNKEVVPCGEGDGCLQELISKLNKDVVLTVEPHLRVFDSYKQIDNTELKNKYVFNSNEEAFNFAVAALKRMLVENGFKEVEGAFIK